MCDFLKKSMNGNENCLDSSFWHACAGTMVQMPLVKSKVLYFPQGHVEHMQIRMNFSISPRIPPFILCRVNSVRYMADLETDEIYAKILMSPLKGDEQDYCEEDGLTLTTNGLDLQEKPVSFAKMLTQSDANNGGGFSVPRYCAETIFPRLDYSVDPPVQEILARDVHNKFWKFRHIYRGTPRRHLLTTGWSGFVNEKKLVSGDSIVFLKRESGEICMGIRRVKRGLEYGIVSTVGWNHPTEKNMYGGISILLKEDANKLTRGKNYGCSSTRFRGKVMEDSVIQAMTLAANGQPFEVVYYPSASTPQFCVNASTVEAAMRFQWCSGLRFKMPFETEDSSRISWFSGTVYAAQFFDPLRWPGSPWRYLQVLWDDPDLLQNVKNVNPWLVELVTNIPASIHFSPFTPLRKKPRITQPPNFLPIFQQPTLTFSGNLLIPSSSPLCLLPDSTPAVGIQGARQTSYGLFHTKFHQLDKIDLPLLTSTEPIVPNPTVDDDEFCPLALANHPQSGTNGFSKEKKTVILFGKVILTEEELSLTKTESSDMNSERTNVSDVSGTVYPNATGDSSFSEVHYMNLDQQVNEVGQCKVLMESDNVSCILDLSTFGSYEGLYWRLAFMYGIEKSDLANRLVYQDTAGMIKHIEDEPYGSSRDKAVIITSDFCCCICEIIQSEGEYDPNQWYKDANLVSYSFNPPSPILASKTTSET